jgi:plasmid replication initiation protein
MKKSPEVAESQKIAKRKKGVIKAKSEFFRSARYGLTLQEHRIIYYAILAGQQDGKPFEPVTLSVGAFRELFEVSSENYYSELRRLSKKLIGKSVEVVYKDQDGQHLLQATWLKGINYNTKEGSVTITPNEMLKPFFEGKPFSTSEYYFLIRFTSQYAERLYEILKSLDHKTVIDFDLSDLSTRLAVPASYRKNYTDLKRFALDPAIKDINEFTDLDVDIREKRGLYNKVITVFFSVRKKKAPKLADRIELGEFRPPLSEEEQSIVMRELMGDELPGQQTLEGGEVANEYNA